MLLGIFTIIGAIMALGRVFDAVTDPWIASLSDKCKSGLGRWIPFLKWAALPLAVSTLLVFCAPVGHASAVNVVWHLWAASFWYFIMRKRSIV